MTVDTTVTSIKIDVLIAFIVIRVVFPAIETRMITDFREATIVEFDSWDPFGAMCRKGRGVIMEAMRLPQGKRTTARSDRRRIVGFDIVLHIFLVRQRRGRLT
jgi:hypothetical protein